MARKVALYSASRCRVFGWVFTCTAFTGVRYVSQLGQASVIRLARVLHTDTSRHLGALGHCNCLSDFNFFSVINDKEVIHLIQ